VSPESVEGRTVQPICERCRTLLGSLQDAKERLGDATVRMHVLVGTGEHEAFNAALRETQSLQTQCRALRAELEHHRAQHHSSSTGLGRFVASSRFRRDRIRVVALQDIDGSGKPDDSEGTVERGSNFGQGCDLKPGRTEL
jgi:hypothetical protein